MQNEKIKNYSHLSQDTDSDQDFHVKGIEQERLIRSRSGDDHEEFVCNMHNFGDSDNLPDSDRDMISASQKCHS